jgi:hypothetical protein
MPRGPITSRPTRTRNLNARFTPDFIDKLRSLAEKKGTTMTKCIENAILREVQEADSN